MTDDSLEHRAQVARWSSATLGYAREVLDSCDENDTDDVTLLAKAAYRLASLVLSEMEPNAGRDAATLVLVALDHLREKLPEMMAKPTSLAIDAETRERLPNRVPRTALSYLADGILGDFEMAPDADWWRDYFLISGHHMILTDNGWEPGEVRSEYEADDILDEVNAP